MRRASKQIWQLLDTTITAMGYEFVGAELGQAENGMTLRVYIDLTPDNRRDDQPTVLVDDCANVSRQVGAVLDVEDPIPGEYALEVSSPGLNRPLFSADQFEAQVGEQVKLKLRKPVDVEGNHRRNFKGTLVGVESGEIELQVDGQNFNLSLDDVEQARLVYAF